MQSLPSRFAWLVGGVLLHGHLLLQELADDASVTDGEEYVADMRQLALAGAHGSPEDEPHMMVSSEPVPSRNPLKCRTASVLLSMHQS